ncbi:coiled-coil domain-containing protein 169 [Thalassophryne amazonica]|uniref:coiled-coil domain-containing protein 169 n=1 Tax=Thalassophryne amazonica TaxID=390379 RepID=UPI0014710A97|nr:coiled-coil domain-containing protein 169 [Thalassophryne amazonica]
MLLCFFPRNMNGGCKTTDFARLQAELEQEKEMKETLEESVSDLQSTMCELQERLKSVDVEGNEWKTRYETQIELNRQLERQNSVIHERLEDLRGNPIDRLASIRSYDEMPLDILKQRLKLLTDEKLDLQSQLMDYHHRIQQEGKAFLKTNDERRAYLSEIAKLSSTLEVTRRQYTTLLQEEPVSKHRKGKQTSQRTETVTKKAGEGGEDGRMSVKGEGGGAHSERKDVKGSRSPTLKQ